MQSKCSLTVATLLLLMVTISAQAGLSYNYEWLYADVDAGGFLLPDEILTFVEHHDQGTLAPCLHQVDLTSNTLTGRGGSTLSLWLWPGTGEPEYVEARLDNLQAERTDTNYSKVFAQGHSYFQFWVRPRDKNYEYDVRITQEYDDGLVPAYLGDGSRAFNLFAVLQGVGTTTQGERGEWWFNGILPPPGPGEPDYHWYGGVRAAAESTGTLSGPFNARIRMDVSVLQEPDDHLWIGADGGLFFTGTNWNPTGQPWGDGRAIFNSPSGADQTVNFGNYPFTARLLVTAPPGQTSSDQVVFDLSGRTYAIKREWNVVNRASVTIGNTAGTTAKLAIIDGTVDAKDIEIALNGTGQLTVGQDGVLTAEEHFISVGTQGNGSMSVVDGGWVHHGHGFAGQYPGSQGMITVDGTRPSDPNVRSRWYVAGWFGLGDQGEGNLSVTNGGEAKIGKCDMAVNPGSQGAAEISGNGSRWELTSGAEVSLIVGMSAQASVNTTSGGSVVSQSEIHLAETSGSTGSLILDGPGRDGSGNTIPALECNQRLTVGYGGVGDFQVLADAGSIIRGALVVGTDPSAPAGTHSQVIVDGTDSSLEVLGRDGDGSVISMEVGRQGAGNLLSITNGSQVVTEYSTTIGGATGGQGSLLVDGLDSMLVPQFQFELGRDAPGEATVSNGGRIFVQGGSVDPGLSDGGRGLALVGMRSTGTLTVTGVNGETPSLLESNGQLVVGAGTGGNGTLNIEQGSSVISRKHLSPSGTAGIVGRDASSTGLVTIKDGSRWEMWDGGLTVGWMGNGRLDMTGGYLRSTYGIIGRTPGSQGEVQISGMIGEDRSHWEIDGSLAIGGDLDGGVGDTGRLSIGLDCWVWMSGSTTIYAPGTLLLSQGRVETTDMTLNGTLEGFGTITGRVTNTTGIVHPTCMGAGTLRELYLEHGYEQQSGGTFVVDVAGDSDYSRVFTWDAADSQTFAGTLRVRILSGYAPPLDSTFDIAFAEGGITAAFDTIDLPTIDGEPVFELYMENPNTLRLRTIREYLAPVDYDSDGDVDQDDLDTFEACATGPGIPFADGDCAKADLDDDNDVDQTDFGAFQRCYSGEGVPVNADCAD